MFYKAWYAGKKSDKPWYDNDCRVANGNQKKLFRLWKRIRGSGYKNDFLKAKVFYRNLYKKKQQEFVNKQRSMLCNINRNPKAFWSTVRKLRKRKFSPCSIPLDELEQLYKETFPPRVITDEMYYDCSHTSLDKDFTVEEVRMILNQLKNGKTPGPDDISNEFLKELPYCWVDYLAKFFNAVFNSEVVPSDWCTSEISLIFKKGDALDPACYRGIALINSIPKIFTSLIGRRLATWCEENEILPECQNGFRKNRLCDDNVLR